MKTKPLPTVCRLVGLTLLLVTLNGCAGASGGGSPAQSSGTPVNPRTDPGGANTPTAALTGAQPRRY